MLVTVSWMVIKCHKSHINPRFCSGFGADSMQIIPSFDDGTYIDWFGGL